MRLALPVLLASLVVHACGGSPVPDRVAVPGVSGASKTAALVRAERRAYDGAPPVIPHRPFGSPCLSCHGLEGVAVPEAGFAPPSPHEITSGLSATSRCVQCHVFETTSATFRANTFTGRRQDLRRGTRLYDGAPPMMPHPAFMRENCSACHSGPAAREEIRTSHPERTRCQQCHVEQTTTETFGGT